MIDYDKIVTCDVECYVNYLLIMFKRLGDSKIVYVEKFNNSTLDTSKVRSILKKYTVVTFNGIKYDHLIIQGAMLGFSNERLKRMSDFIIVGDDGKGNHPWSVKREFDIEDDLSFSHIDLINITPLKASLKIYGGRLHCDKLQDLPIEPSSIIEQSQLESMRKYCENDVSVTSALFMHLESEIKLRVDMSTQYDIDLRSKSDAQIAESVINTELSKNYGVSPQRATVTPCDIYYKAPTNVNFETPVLKNLFEQYTKKPFRINEKGGVEFDFEMVESDRRKSGKNKGQMPERKSKLKIKLGNTEYTCGIGGLHSCEKSKSHTDHNHILRDYDVASYYPSIILNNKLFPKRMGKPFLDVYSKIVRRRLKAKREGNRVVNESLKITINGSFGKFGDRWSTLYSPDLMLQVTITGQLTLLMLIERLELSNIRVVSANTDGVVVKMNVDQESTAKKIVEDWQTETGYVLESSDYISLHSRDVNNYIAIKKDGIKSKGAYADQLSHFYKLRSNPSSEICKEAVKKYLETGYPIHNTIRECSDIRKFVSIRTVNGGAKKENVEIGKSVRWYYGRYELDPIVYSKNGNKVPKSDGAVPLMNLPNALPDDIDYDKYIFEAEKMLTDLGVNRDKLK